jgi:hypothetical protein
MRSAELQAPRPVDNPVIERIRREFGERERQRIRDRLYNKQKYLQEIQGD